MHVIWQHCETLDLLKGFWAIYMYIHVVTVFSMLVDTPCYKYQYSQLVSQFRPVSNIKKLADQVNWVLKIPERKLSSWCII